jgi:hypothetical protein
VRGERERKRAASSVVNSRDIASLLSRRHDGLRLFKFQIVGGSGLLRPLVFLKTVVEGAAFLATEPRQVGVVTAL